MTDMPPPMPAPSPAMGKADIGPRFIARLIDGAIMLALFIAVFIVALIIGQVSGGLGTAIGILGYLAVLGLAFYVFGWGLGETGQTPGKRMQGLKVVDLETGMPLGGGKGIARLLLDGINPCYFSWIVALMDDNNQTAWDKVLTANVVPGEKGGAMPIFPNGKPF